MRARTPLRLRALAAAALVTMLTACRDTPAARPPAAEFLVAAGDSTYWVRPTGSGLRLRGSPILLARFDGRFHEVYVTDDDRSYEDATFVGQRVWRRDLVRGDSVLVFEDTIAPRLARRWAMEHEDARLLEPNEEPAEEPAASAAVDVTVIDVHGPYLSYEYHADVEQEHERPWHTTRRGVIDLRSGRAVSAAELFGADAARRAATAARRSYLQTVDSLLQSTDDRAEPFAASLDHFAFDPSSFIIEGGERSPAVAFFVPGRGEGRAGDLAIPLPAVRMPVPAWWADVRRGLPAEPADPGARTGAAAPGTDRWTARTYAVTAEYDDAGAALTLHDAARRRWRIGRVQAPVHHIHWLDAPAVDSAARRGLARAFDEAVFYDETVRTAAHVPAVRGGRPRCSLARVARPTARG